MFIENLSFSIFPIDPAGISVMRANPRPAPNRASADLRGHAFRLKNNRKSMIRVVFSSIGSAKFRRGLLPKTKFNLTAATKKPTAGRPEIDSQIVSFNFLYRVIRTFSQAR